MVEDSGVYWMYRASGTGTLLEQVQALFTTGTAVGLSDSDLLERFLNHGRESGQAAFTALVERHGPMVLRVCNQALRDPHAAEDAFQATFLVLARKARSIRQRDSVESWLFGVASRAAARIRMMEARRQRYERRGASVRACGDNGVPDSSGPWSELHAEIALLAEKYRVPIVLCYFEGLTHDQAAARLGWPVGTVKTRLARARDQLRRRLENRGCSPLLLVPAEYLRPSDCTAVPRLLLDSTIRAAGRFAFGAGSGEFLSSNVLAISLGVLRTMLINKLRLMSITLVAGVALALGVMVLARQVPGERQVEDQTGQVFVPANDSPQRRVLSLQGATDFVPETVIRIHSPFDCRSDKVLVDLGSSVRRGDPLLELFSADLVEAKSNYEATISQWVRDKKVLDYKTPLAEGNEIARKELIEAENDEAQSRLKMKLAKDKLLFYGLTEKEIENAKTEDGVQKARMILRSRADGVVVQRNVVPGNYYDSKDTLLEIAGMDTLWVRASIDQRVAGALEIGQPITVTFPVSNRTVNTTVQYIGREAEPETGKVLIRASIPNPEHRLKAGMRVRLGVELGAAVPSTSVDGSAAQRKSDLNLDGRLKEVERTLERLVDEKDGRSSNAEILRRLSELERQLDRALSLGKGK
jgi:RNA polymerase sigma factor (sigma-70 family)